MPPFILPSPTPLILDGATGTNLQKRGLPRGASSEAWLFDNPAEIIRLHRTFVEAGSDIILTNTFGGSPLRLKESGLEGKVVEANRTAVELARQAIELARQAIGDRAVYVAGSIGPSGGLLKPYGPLEEDAVYTSFAAQAEALSQAGADLLVVETQFDLKEAGLAVKAARSVSDLPIVCSFSYDRGTRTMMGVSPSKMAQEIVPLGVVALGINCGRSLEDNLKALQELKAASDLPIWFKPNAGLPVLDQAGEAAYSVSPAEMGAQARQWLAAGAGFIGGCCGTSPEHLAEIARTVKG